MTESAVTTPAVAVLSVAVLSVLALPLCPEPQAMSVVQRRGRRISFFICSYSSPLWSMRVSAEGLPVIMEGLYVPNVCPIGECINWSGVFLGGGGGSSSPRARKWGGEVGQRCR